jgi:methylase of polypeptide subunit release factors
MDKPMSIFHLKLIAFAFMFRNFFLPAVSLPEEAWTKPGFHVLDYGCGLGRYIISLGESLGKLRRIYALDIHPHAFRGFRALL